MTCDKCNGSGTYSIGKWLRQYTCVRCFGTGKPVLGVAYAGVGSRETPKPICDKMQIIGTMLALRGWVLRSGEAPRKVPHVVGTDSADLAFERGCDAVNGRKIIRVAAGATGGALEHAARYHPAWDACNDHAKRLHARNSLIMCGDYLDDPVRFVVCWTPGGAVTGGTGQALRIAPDIAAPVFNLAEADAEARLWGWLPS